jgi:hypothetical protein
MKLLMIAALLGMFFTSQAFAVVNPAHCPYQAKRHLACQDQPVE